MTIHTGAPTGFVSYTRGAFLSEERAVKAAETRGPSAVVVHEPANRAYAEVWYVGFLPSFKL